MKFCGNKEARPSTSGAIGARAAWASGEAFPRPLGAGTHPAMGETAPAGPDVAVCL